MEGPILTRHLCSLRSLRTSRTTQILRLSRSAPGLLSRHKVASVAGDRLPCRDSRIGHPALRGHGDRRRRGRRRCVSSVTTSPGVTMSLECFARLGGRPMLMAMSPSRSTPPSSESESDEAAPSRLDQRGTGFGCIIVMGILTACEATRCDVVRLTKLM